MDNKNKSKNMGKYRDTKDKSSESEKNIISGEKTEEQTYKFSRTMTSGGIIVLLVIFLIIFFVIYNHFWK